MTRAQKQKETELAKIYSARGETERYAGNYRDAANWYEKALTLAPDDRNVWEPAGLIFYFTADYNRAEPLMRRALKIDEDSFGPNHPSVATALNNLAELLRETNRLDEAVPLYNRALKIDEDSFGKDHPNVARDLNNLALLLAATNRLSEAEPLMRRALKICEDSLGPDHPSTITARNNLRLLK